MDKSDFQETFIRACADMVGIDPTRLSDVEIQTIFRMAFHVVWFGCNAGEKIDPEISLRVIGVLSERVLEFHSVTCSEDGEN